MESPIHSYEDVRRKRVEDNLKQLEGLGIASISKSLQELTKSKPKQLKSHTSKAKILLETSELRRSSRMRNQVLSYRDDVVGISDIRSYSRRRYKGETIGREYTGRTPSVEEKVHALKRAEMLLRQVACDHASFIKPMGLPAKFCKDHLPLRETKMVLEDEKGDEHEAMYIGRRTGLSGGWRSFAVDHGLEDGDALIFKLIEPTRFKVYIVKAIGSSAVAMDDKSTIGDVCAPLEPSAVEGLACSKPVWENESADPAGNPRRRKQSRPRPSN